MRVKYSVQGHFSARDGEPQRAETPLLNQKYINKEEIHHFFLFFTLSRIKIFDFHCTANPTVKTFKGHKEDRNIITVADEKCTAHILELRHILTHIVKIILSIGPKTTF